MLCLRNIEAFTAIIVRVYLLLMLSYGPFVVVFFIDQLVSVVCLYRWSSQQCQTGHAIEQVAISVHELLLRLLPRRPLSKPLASPSLSFQL